MKRRDFLKVMGAGLALAATGASVPIPHLRDLGLEESLALSESGLYVAPTLEQNTEFVRTIWALDKTSTYDPTQWRIIDRAQPYSQRWADNVWGPDWGQMERVTALYKPSGQGFELSRTKDGFVLESDFGGKDLDTAQTKAMGIDLSTPQPLLDYNKNLSLIAADLIPLWAKQQGFIHEPEPTIIPARPGWRSRLGLGAA